MRYRLGVRSVCLSSKMGDRNAVAGNSHLESCTTVRMRQGTVYIVQRSDSLRWRSGLSSVRGALLRIGKQL